MVHLSPKHKVPTRVYSPFTVIASENVFCQGTVVLLNPVCVLLSEHFMFKERTTCCSFRDVMSSKTLASIQRLKSKNRLDLYF